MGRAIAHAASREVARLVLADFDGERLKTTAGELTGDVRHQRADVTRTVEIDAVFDLAEREFGRIDGLVTCAGIITTLPLLEITSQEWDRVFAVNAKGTFFTVRAALRRMLPRGQGSIVTIGSASYKLGRFPWAASASRRRSRMPSCSCSRTLPASCTARASTSPPAAGWNSGLFSG